ncbi:MAG: serine/threonine-protein kinase, partial [Myxococcota bacterium]
MTDRADDRGEVPEISGYELGHRLGAGGFGQVWAARRRDGEGPRRDVRDGHANRFAAAVKVGRDAGALTVQRFARESQALGAVGPPWVPELHGSGQLGDGRPYLIMQRIAAPTLASYLAGREHPPEPATALAIADALLCGLEAIHKTGLIHRDLKPSNIFAHKTSASWAAVIADFGLARAEDSHELTRTGVAVGSPAYASPEQLAGVYQVDGRADLYSFGVILFELLTLRWPFIGDSRAIEHGHATLRPPAPSAVAAVPEWLDQVVLSCLAKKPEHRPDSAGAVRALLAAARPTGPRPPAQSSESDGAP